MSTTSKLKQLRSLMQKNNIHAYIVPTADAHQSEYVPRFAARREYISGFTGSAGTAVITLDKARLWTDGRYFLQASTQLDANWQLMKDRLPETPTVQQWLIDEFKGDTEHCVGTDDSLVSLDWWQQVEKAFQTSTTSKLKLVGVEKNLIDEIWSDQPAVPSRPIVVQTSEYAGNTLSDKLALLRAKMNGIDAELTDGKIEADGDGGVPLKRAKTEAGAAAATTSSAKKRSDAIALTALDDIAWAFNIRGGDIIYNPVVISYALVTRDDATLFVDEAKLTAEARQHFGDLVRVQPYEAFFDALVALREVKRTVWIDAATCSRRAAHCVGALAYKAQSPCVLPKAIKNEAELRGMRECHIRDAAACVQFFAWLEKRVHSDETPLDEVVAADHLAALRAEQELFVDLSFDTISGADANGAIIHYKPEPHACAVIKKDTLYLCDSGGQYRDGTTDITRTVHLGTPSGAQRRAYTRVLQGHVDLALAIFPHSTTGAHLDILARQPLWRDGLDYRHGTGHGVGSFLNVHEGPHGISWRPSCHKQPLLPGMIVSNEPGYYEDGHFGIRIENCMEIVEKETPNHFGSIKYYGMEHLTLVPYEKELTDVKLLTAEQREHINAYHKRCWTEVSPLVQNNLEAMQWLKKRCQPW